MTRAPIVAFGVVCILTASAFGPSAQAACRWTFVDGQQEQLCDSPTDRRSATKPLVIPPMLPAAIPPIRPAVVPPAGTTSCRQAQVWNGSAYRWRSLCQ